MERRSASLLGFLKCSLLNQPWLAPSFRGLLHLLYLEKKTNLQAARQTNSQTALLRLSSQPATPPPSLLLAFIFAISQEDEMSEVTGFQLAVKLSFITSHLSVHAQYNNISAASQVHCGGKTWQCGT